MPPPPPLLNWSGGTAAAAEEWEEEGDAASQVRLFLKEEEAAAAVDEEEWRSILHRWRTWHTTQQAGQAEQLGSLIFLKSVAADMKHSPYRGAMDPLLRDQEAGANYAGTKPELGHREIHDSRTESILWRSILRQKAKHARWKLHQQQRKSAASRVARPIRKQQWRHVPTLPRDCPSWVYYCRDEYTWCCKRGCILLTATGTLGTGLSFGLGLG